MSHYCDTPFAMIFDVARAERALDNYKLVTPSAYELEATRSGCNREGFKLLQKYTMTSFFSHLAGQDIMRYLEGQIIIGPAPQPYPANYSCLVCQEDLPLPEPMPVLGPVSKTSNGKFTSESQARILEHYEKMQSWEMINLII